jgi:hypothetical protein
VKQVLAQAITVAVAKQEARRLSKLMLSSSESESERQKPGVEARAPRMILESSGTPLHTFAMPVAVSTSELHHRFDQAVRVVYDSTLGGHERECRVRERQLSGFLIADDDTWRLTDSAWDMVEAFPFIEGASYSACAELLSKHATDEAQELSTRLRDHVLRWHVTGLFRKNLVPEIVLHDEPHAQAVDRHVAALLEPALSSGAVGPADVYLVALAAWLHDWGHASGGGIGAAPTAGADVRTLHGALSSRRIGDPHSVHARQLGLTPEESIWAALLAEHHQSWTSCDGRRPPIDGAGSTLAERFGLQVSSFTDDVGHAIEQMAKLDPSLRGLSHDWAQTLLAVLRVADGADVGVHRTPHMIAPISLAADEWSSVFSKAVETARALDGVARPEGSSEEALRRLFNDRTVASLLKKSRPGLTGLDEASLTEEVDKIIAEAFGGEVPKALSANGTDARGQSIVEDLKRTLAHLIKQQYLYYPQHASVAGVHLVPSRHDGKNTVFRVLVRIRHDLELDPNLKHLTDQQVVDLVRRDVLKEVGLVGDKPEWHTPLNAALKRIGLVIDDDKERGVEILKRTSNSAQKAASVDEL